MTASSFGPPSLRTGLRKLQALTAELNHARDLRDLLKSLLASLRDMFGVEHATVLLTSEMAATLGVPESLGHAAGTCLPAELVIGRGLFGKVAQSKRTLRVSREIDGELPSWGGIADAASRVVVPLISDGQLVGMILAESRDPAGFDEWHEAAFDIVGHQVAGMIELVRARHGSKPSSAIRATRTFSWYRNDDCIFVDDQYLIRNVPGRILWKLLRSYVEERRTEFTNRELRLDIALGLPAVKDNLESRLILLRKRLGERCSDIRIVPESRGKFRFEADCDLRLVTKSSEG
ncbi:GAF domain-containing protein [Pendulispora albinea]|uniref:GAF domain-containing protein n=1 Tax=Pendulispora albinea TaxID=2741071 RepID=A0ABZ2M9L7_9BACT